MKGELFKIMAFDIGESVFINESEVIMYIRLQSMKYNILDCFWNQKCYTCYTKFIDYQLDQTPANRPDCLIWFFLLTSFKI